MAAHVCNILPWTAMPRKCQTQQRSKPGRSQLEEPSGTSFGAPGEVAQQASPQNSKNLSLLEFVTPPLGQDSAAKQDRAVSI